MAFSDFTQIAFSSAVKKLQEKWGVRSHNEELGRKQAARGLTKITPALAEWLEICPSFYMASASLDGQPYMQHRGGPPGFIKILDEQHIAFADYPGNKQYISLGQYQREPAHSDFHHGLCAKTARENLGNSGGGGAGTR